MSHHGLSDEELQERLLAIDVNTLETMDRSGIEVCGVFGEADSSAFAYSIGLTRLGSPEVCVAGLDMRVAQHVINEIHRRLKEGIIDYLAPGVVIPGVLGGNNEYHVRLCAVSKHECYRVGRFFPEFTVLQAVFTDFDHNYPWDDGYTVDPRVQKDWWIRP